MRLFLIIILIITCGNLFAQAWHPVGDKIKTRWTKDVTPENAWREYPRPQMVRNEWLNLNGLWDYAVTGKDNVQPSDFEGKILVPFCIESSLSGLGKDLQPNQELWYKTTFTVPDSWKNNNILLHFGAVDYKTTVKVNGQIVGTHIGSSDPFSFDITNFLKKGIQELIVTVWDPTDSDIQPRGKQALKPFGFWYTAVSGIYQTVWIEPVNKTSISSIQPIADIDNNKINILTKVVNPTGKESIKATVFAHGKLMAEKTADVNEKLIVDIENPVLWSPDNPFLYSLRLDLVKSGKIIDQVESYFAMRKISSGVDELGFQKIFLNNNRYFNFGVLDQGWWPDGLLTPPSDDALKYDIEVLKDMGFNTIRKHIKVEPARFYYHCDRLGMLVWQDMPSGFISINDPIQHVSHNAVKDWDRPEESATLFKQEWKSIMDNLKFFPSIAVWIPFNEGWGQFDSKNIVNWTMSYDPTRLVDGISGWSDRNVGNMYDSHQYPGPAIEPAEQNPGRCIVLGEFGGLGLPVEGHEWNPEKRSWGYRTYETPSQLITEYAKLIHNLKPELSRGLAGAIYTQTTDVEEEANGLMTYDREEIKVPVSMMRMINAEIFEKPKSRAKFIIRDKELELEELTQEPATPNKNVNEKSVNSDIPAKILEKEFVLEKLVENIAVKMYAWGSLKIFLNDKVILDRIVRTKRHFDDLNISEFRNYFKVGINKIRFELRDYDEKAFLDFGLYEF